MNPFLIWQQQFFILVAIKAQKSATIHSRFYMLFQSFFNDARLFRELFLF